MKTLLDIENWPRKEHFHFFRKFDEPFFGATVTIDCTKAYANAKKANASFFIWYLHKTLMAVNAIENFRYRISEDHIYIWDVIHASATISREDGTFGFSRNEFHPDFETFSTNAVLEMARVKNTPGLFTRTFEEDDLIHFSAIPWIDFTSLSHARSYAFKDSCPKISFGKMTLLPDGTRSMSMSVHVHHALMDGLHLGQFIDYFQKEMNR